MPRIKDLSNYTGALNRSDIYFAVDGNSFSRGMSLSGQQVYTMCKGTDGKNIELRASTSYIQWRQEGDTSWANLISVSDLKGADGKELEIRVNGGYIQTRLAGGTWASLIAVADLKGDKGDPADNPAFTFVVSALAWDAVPTASITGTYPNLTVNLGIPKGKDADAPAFAFNISALEWNAAPTASVTGTYPDLTVNLGIPKGKDADTPVFTTNSIKGSPDENPEVSVSGTYPNLELAFKIPEGLRGEQGKPLVVLANGNYGNWNESTQQYDDSGVQASATVDLENVPVAFTEAATRETINTGETVPTVFGKLKKWFSDLGALAWKSKVDYQNDINNLPTLVTSTDINNAVNTHDISGETHSDIRTSLTTLQQNTLTALRVHEGTGISVTAEEDGSITLSANVDAEIFITVTELPDAGVENKIYLVPKTSAQAGDTLNEYIWINGEWELVGSVSVDMSNYDTSLQVDTKIGEAVDVHDKDKSAHHDSFAAIKPFRTSAMLYAANWIKSADNTKWYYQAENAAIGETDAVLFAPTVDYEDLYIETGFYSQGVASNGKLQVYARNKPTDNILLAVTILK